MKKAILYFIYLVVFSQMVYAANVLEIDFSIGSDDVVNLNEMRVRDNVLPTPFFIPGDYTLQILDSNNNLLINESLDVDFCRLSYPPVCYDRTSAYFALEFSENMKVFKLFREGAEIFRINIVLCNNDDVCNEFEDFLSCSQDCPLNENDVICLPESDGVCDPDCGKGVDPDCVQEFYSNAGEDRGVFFKETVNFHGGVANPGTGVYTYEWFFGDDGSTAVGQDVTHVFEDYGIFAVELKVTNQAGISKTDTLMVTAKSCSLNDFTITDSVRLKSYEICEPPDGITLASDNIVFDCNGAKVIGGKIGYWTNGFSFYNRKNVTIKNCEISGSYSNGILGVGSEGVTIFNNSFSDVGADGVSVESSSDVLISGNSFVNVWHGAHVSSSEKVRVLNNEFEHTNVSIFVDSFRSLGDFYSTDSLISGNVIRDVSYAGIFFGSEDLEEARDAVIENNLIVNVSGEVRDGIKIGFGILIASFINEHSSGELGYSLARNVTVKDNVVENAFNGIGLISSNFEDMSFGSILQDVSVTGNVVRDAKIHGISASNWRGGDEKAVIRNVLISDNDVTSLQYNPINLYDVESLTMFNNVLKALMLGRAALSLQNTTYSVVSNNSMGGLIWLGDVKSSQITNNNIKGYYRNGVYSLNSENVNLVGNVISVEPPVGIWGRAVYDEGSKDFYVRENVLKGPYNNQSSGVYLFSTENSLVEGNSLEGFYEGVVVRTNDSKVINNSVVWGAYGVEVYSSAATPDQTFSISIEDNVIDGKNVGPPYSDYSYGIASFLNSDKGSLSVKKNVISNIGNPDDPYIMGVNGTNTNLGRGIRVDTDNSVVEDNLVENTTWAGIASNDGSNITFRNNVLKNAYGMLVRAWSEKCYNNLFENNVIVGGSSAGVGGCGIEVRGCDNDIVRNNSISLVNSGIRTRSQGSFTSNNVLIENNVVTSPEPARVFVDGWWGSQAYGILLEDGGDNHTIRNNFIDLYPSGYPKNSVSHGIGVFGDDD